MFYISDCLNGKMKQILCSDWLTKRGYPTLLRPGGNPLLFGLNGYVQLDRVMNLKQGIQFHYLAS